MKVKQGENFMFYSPRNKIYSKMMYSGAKRSECFMFSPLLYNIMKSGHLSCVLFEHLLPILFKIQTNLLNLVEVIQNKEKQTLRILT